MKPDWASLGHASRSSSTGGAVSNRGPTLSDRSWACNGYIRPRLSRDGSPICPSDPFSLIDGPIRGSAGTWLAGYPAGIIPSRRRAGVPALRDDVERIWPDGAMVRFGSTAVLQHLSRGHARPPDRTFGSVAIRPYGWGRHSGTVFGVGRLIHVAVGLAMGTGALLTKRAGCSANARSSVT